MSKEFSEKKKTNPLVYILGIPVGILILVMAYIQWEKYQIYRFCAENTFITNGCALIFQK